MWIINVLPEWVFHLMFFAGLIGTIMGFVLGFIPFVKKYSIPIKVISVLVLALGTFLEGSLADYREWEFKVKELEVKVKEAEAKSAKINTEVVTKVVTQKIYIKEKGQEVTKYVDREIVKYDVKYLPGGVCEIPLEVIKAHDAAAKGKGIEVDSNTPIPTDDINKAAKGQK